MKLARLSASSRNAPHRERRALLRCIIALPLALHLQARAADPCCGALTSHGRRLRKFLDHSGVDQLWLPGYQVDWQTGARKGPWPGGSGSHTHCSAFVAAAAMRLGVYILRPPEHKQNLLANAQMAWLEGPEGQASGWARLAGAADAQTAANRGELVVACVRNPDPHRPGHIAIVRPGDISQQLLQKDGPMVTQAGAQNAIEVSLARGFRGHRGAWKPDGSGAVQFFAHVVDWANVKESA